MSGTPVIVGQERTKDLRVNPVLGWTALRVVALLFVCIGTADIALAFYPPQFENPSWTFGVLGGAIGGLPVLSLGISAGVLAGLTLRRRGWTVLLGAVSALLALLIAAGTVVFFQNVDEARRTAPVGMQLGISRTILRTYLLGGLFILLHTAVAVMAFRGDRMSGGSNT
jgi:hypothetical protein